MEFALESGCMSKIAAPSVMTFYTECLVKNSLYNEWEFILPHAETNVIFLQYRTFFFYVIFRCGQWGTLLF